MGKMGCRPSARDIIWRGQIPYWPGQLAVQSWGEFSAEHIATALYRGILDREPDLAGFGDNVDHLRSGGSLERVIRSFVASPEFRS